MSVQDVKPEDFGNIDIYNGMENKFSQKEQYTIHRIPKKSGGMRIIEAPSDELKEAQKRSLRRLVFLLEVSHFAHAFAMGKNIASAAAPHVGKEVVLTVDLTDFFPSVKWYHFCDDVSNGSILPMFTDTDGGKKTQEPAKFRSYRSVPEFVFGKSKWASTSDWRKKYNAEILPLMKMHFCDFGDGKGTRLPQGAPASPFLSNVLLCRQDYRIGWAGYPNKVEYSRYADDLIFSGADVDAVKRTYGRAVSRLAMLHLSFNPRKYTLKQGNQRKKCTGLVINEKLNTTRYFRRRLRAMNHHCSVIFTLIELSKERGFQLPQRLKPFLLSKTEGMTFGQKMRSIVDEINTSGGDISMEDLASKNLRNGAPAYTKKISGHRAFQHMINTPPTDTQGSLDFCAVHTILRMA